MPDSLRFCVRIALFLLALAGLGCGDSHAPDASLAPIDLVPAEPEESEPGEDGMAEDLDQKVGTAEDQSLTSEEYVQMGIPTPNRNWTGADMAAAAAVLTNLAASEPEKLPRYRSPRSGAIFDRLCTENNLDHYLTASLPLESRSADVMRMMVGCNSISRLYTAQILGGKRFYDEYVELLCAQLRLDVVALQLIDFLLQTLDSRDPTYEKRLDGLRQLREGAAETIFGGLRILNRDKYSTSQRKRFFSSILRSMRETSGEILAPLPKEYRAEIVTKLTALKRDPEMAGLEPELSELIDAIVRE